MTTAETLARTLTDDCPYRDAHHPAGPHPDVDSPDYPTWGSACLAWAIERLREAGAKRYSGGGYILPDGSILRATHQPDPNPEPRYAHGFPPPLTIWEATSPEARPPVPLAPPNPYGITNMTSASDMDGTHLRAKLDELGVNYEVIPITHLVGMGGEAYLTVYVSPRTGRPVTVFVIPHRDIDSWTEEYFYCDGMTRAQAVARSEEEWIAVYDATREWWRKA